MLSLPRFERKQKNSSNPFRIRIFFFLSYSFGIETIKTFIQSRSSLKNRTRFQTKMGKVYTRFSDQNRTKTLPDGAAHTYIAYLFIYLFIYCNKMPYLIALDCTSLTHSVDPWLEILSTGADLHQINRHYFLAN